VQGPPTTSNSQQLLNLSGLGAALELATNSSLLSIMVERDINSNSSLNTTTTVSSSTMEEVEATPSSPHLTITSLGLILRLRGRNTRLFSLNSSPWRWSSSLHNTRNLSRSNSSIISSRCTYSLSSSNTHIT